MNTFFASVISLSMIVSALWASSLYSDDFGIMHGAAYYIQSAADDLCITAGNITVKPRRIFSKGNILMKPCRNESQEQQWITRLSHKIAPGYIDKAANISPVMAMKVKMKFFNANMTGDFVYFFPANAMLVNVRNSMQNEWHIKDSSKPDLCYFNDRSNNTLTMTKCQPTKPFIWKFNLVQEKYDFRCTFFQNCTKIRTK